VNALVNAECVMPSMLPAAGPPGLDESAPKRWPRRGWRLLY
jgi:hypothetical protein